MINRDECAATFEKVTSLREQARLDVNAAAGTVRAIDKMDKIEKWSNEQTSMYENDAYYRRGCRIRFKLGEQGLTGTCELTECTLFDETSTN